MNGWDRLAVLIEGIYDTNLKHMQLNTWIQVDGERATATTDLMVQSALADAGWQTIAHGRYEDTMVCRDGGWRFERRMITWHRATPAEVTTQLRGLMAAGC